MSVGTHAMLAAIVAALAVSGAMVALIWLEPYLRDAKAAQVESVTLEDLPDAEVVGDPPRLVYDRRELFGTWGVAIAGGGQSVRLCWEERHDGTWEPVAYAEGEQ